jgi:hypothetical protein
MSTRSGNIIRFISGLVDNPERVPGVRGPKMCSDDSEIGRIVIVCL